MNKYNTANKILPNRVFHTLWDDAQKYEKSDFAKRFLHPHSEHYIDFEKKYHISDAEAQYLLNAIFECANLSVAEIVKRANVKESTIVHSFCIPRSTTAEWYYGRNPCPSYIRLMMVRHFHLLDLGRYIFIEEEIDTKNRQKPKRVSKKMREAETTASLLLELSQSESNSEEAATQRHDTSDVPLNHNKPEKQHYSGTSNIATAKEQKTSDAQSDKLANFKKYFEMSDSEYDQYLKRLTDLAKKHNHRD